ncbi:DNA polymerase III subunit beta [Candidatus Saccharibacteria bacterium]|nr:DNA polymerase III subunit beta [Candidatus Saccharibacteria bacterium]
MTKFKIKQGLLRSFLVPLAHIASTSTKLPVAKNIYLQVNSDGLVFKATNLTLGLIQKTADITNFSGDPVDILIAAKPFLEIVNILPGGNIEFSINNNQLKIITKQNQTVFQISDTKQFPVLPDLDNNNAQKISIDASILKDLTNKTLFARSSDTSRPIINGVFMSSRDKKLYIATTDGYRLSDFLVGDCDEDVKVILPAGFLLELNSIVGDKSGNIDLFIDEDGIKAEFKDATLFSYIIDGKYPDYKALIPAKNAITLVLDKNELLQTIRATQVFARENHSIVILKTDSKKNEITFRSVANEYGENISTIPTQVSGDAEITLNSRYIIDGGNSLTGDRVILGLDDASRPLVMKQAIDDDSFIHLIMPIRG